MTVFRFDPPLTLKGNIIIGNLDDAVRFMVGYRRAADHGCRRVYYIALKEQILMELMHFGPSRSVSMIT
jgi:hypothetical protein